MEETLQTKLPKPEIDTTNNGQVDSNIVDTPIEQQADTDNNGIVSQEERFSFENRQDDLSIPILNDTGYESFDSIKKNVPDWNERKWYHHEDPEGTEGDYFYSLVEDVIESNPEESIEMAEQLAEASPEISKKDVEPIIEEAKQVTDSDKRNDEVSNETIEKIEKKIGSFMPDIPTKEISQKEYDDMSIDEIEKADEAAMKGEEDYLTVAKDLGLENDDLYYFEDPHYFDNLTKEQKEEIKNEPDKKKKLDLLKLFGMKANPNLNNGDSLSSEDSTISKEEQPITSSVDTSTSQISGGSSGGSTSSSISVEESLDNNIISSNAAGGNIDVSVAERDSNEGSQNGANINKALDDSFDSLSFKETPHEESIKTNEQFQLEGKEGHTSDSNKGVKLKLPKNASKDDVKKALLKDSKEWGGNDSKSKFLPFRFIVDGNDIIVSQIGTARKLPFDEFIKKEPNALKQIMEKLK